MTRLGHRVVLIADPGSTGSSPQRLQRLTAFSPQRCSAAERFPIARSAKGYLDLYQRILDGETLP